MIPKYRGLSIVDDYHFGEWIYGNLIIDGNRAYIVNRVVECTDEYIAIEQWCEVDITTVGQSTGIKDQKGVEIYEGDIVKVTDDYGSTDFTDGGIGTICGLNDLYMWYIDGQVHNGLYDIEQCYYIEVIGNIHQNPELSEVSHD